MDDSTRVTSFCAEVDSLCLLISPKYIPLPGRFPGMGMDLALWQPTPYKFSHHSLTPPSVSRRSASTNAASQVWARKALLALTSVALPATAGCLASHGA